jgi:hypothetical protein
VRTRYAVFLAMKGVRVMSKGFLELLLVFGSVLALAVYELVSVSRSLRNK